MGQLISTEDLLEESNSERARHTCVPCYVAEAECLWQTTSFRNVKVHSILKLMAAFFTEPLPVQRHRLPAKAVHMDILIEQELAPWPIRSVSLNGVQLLLKDAMEAFFQAHQTCSKYVQKRLWEETEQPLVPEIMVIIAARIRVESWDAEKGKFKHEGCRPCWDEMVMSLLESNRVLKVSITRVQSSEIIAVPDSDEE